MVYQWKVQGLYKVDAQTAGDELERIYTQKGRLEPEDIVEESRPDSAPLHPVFEWDDAVAAEKYRKVQARGIIRTVVTVKEEKKESSRFRVFVHVQNKYQPMSVVVHSQDKLTELKYSALRELQIFQRKNRELQEVELYEPVFSAIDKVSAELEGQM